MRKSSSAISLIVLAALSSVGCSGNRGDEWGQGPPRDPCDKQYFDRQRCEEAVRSKGYHYGGNFYPHVYGNPYPYYYDNYNSYVGSGGVHRAIPGNVYSPSYVRPSTGFFGGIGRGGGSSSSSATRGGFGGTFSGGGGFGG